MSNQPNTTQAADEIEATGWFATAEEALGLYHRTEVRKVQTIHGWKFAVWCDACGSWVNARGPHDPADSWLPLWSVERSAAHVAEAHTQNLSIAYPAEAASA